MMTSLGLSFSFSKPLQLISHLINLHPNKHARILDFFAGSGTTAHSVLELNREDGGNRSYTLVTNNEK
ncbi:DNA methyltransferase [Mycoplasmopsis synoviae]|uniref:DNA methyltransferase n=1 Tax=Mycoplasmopsis synoviae TaxID=2109 RepID=UPI0034DB6861